MTLSHPLVVWEGGRVRGGQQSSSTSSRRCCLGPHSVYRFNYCKLSYEVLSELQYYMFLPIPGTHMLVIITCYNICKVLLLKDELG